MSRGWEKLSAADVARLGRKAPHVPQKPRSKYAAVPTTVDGIRFHSAKEARRYEELKLLQKSGAIRRMKRQVVFALHVIGGQVKDRAIHLGSWCADFTYDERVETPAPNSDWWQPIVEDVKGFKTPLYRWKKKHVEAQYGITIRET